MTSCAGARSVFPDRNWWNRTPLSRSHSAPAPSRNRCLISADSRCSEQLLHDGSQRHASSRALVLGGVCADARKRFRSEEHTSELQSRRELVCRLLLEKKKETRSWYAGG